jgi:hypothetical protein
LFLLALGRLPEVKALRTSNMSTQLQHVLDRFDPSPALIRTGLWDVRGWNKAVTRFLVDFATLPPDERNLLSIVFRDPSFRAAQSDWQTTARSLVGAFWRDVVRAGATDAAEALIVEVSRQAPELMSLWREKQVHNEREGIKRFHHPQMGPLAFEYSTFGVHSRADLTMVVFNAI